MASWLDTSVLKQDVIDVHLSQCALHSINYCTTHARFALSHPLNNTIHKVCKLWKLTESGVAYFYNKTLHPQYQFTFLWCRLWHNYSLFYVSSSEGVLGLEIWCRYSITLSPGPLSQRFNVAHSMQHWNAGNGPGTRLSIPQIISRSNKSAFCFLWHDPARMFLGLHDNMLYILAG